MEFRGGAGGEGVGSKVEDGVRSAAKEGGGSAANEVSGNITEDWEVGWVLGRYAG